MTQPTISQTLQLALRDHSAGKYAAAEKLYCQVLSQQPKNTDALHLLGVLHHQTGRLDSAIDLIEQARTINPKVTDYHNSLGNALWQSQKFADAVAAYREAIRLKPDWADAHNNLGNALHSQGKFDESIAALEQALRLNPNLAGAHNNLGNSLRAMGKFDESIAAYRRAVALKPDWTDALQNLASALQQQGKFDESAALYEEILRLRGDVAELYNNLGIDLRGTGRLDDAIAAYRKALHIKPAAEFHNNLGFALHCKGRFDEAVDAYKRAIAMKPDYAEAHHNLALTLLLAGNLTEGWREYEWRWRCPDFPSPQRNFSQPPWDGSDLNGRSILLYTEQGLGDTIQFARYVPMVAERGKVVLQCQPQLIRLLSNLPGVAEVIPATASQPLPHFDIQCALLRLPMIFGTALETIPRSIPYISANPERSAKWSARLTGFSGTKIGIAWAGSRGHKNDRNRSLPLPLLAPLASIPGIQLFSLQKEAPPGEARALSEMNWIDYTAELTDFADTAALIADLDLVISVDTAVAHLAGAMAKPTWLLLPHVPDWRWLMDREDSPWYPTLRLFRQKTPGDWSEVIQRIAVLLK